MTSPCMPLCPLPICARSKANAQARVLPFSPAPLYLSPVFFFSPGLIYGMLRLLLPPPLRVPLWLPLLLRYRYRYRCSYRCGWLGLLGFASIC